jgi:hypothetical protein
MCGGGLRKLFTASRAVGEEIGDAQLRGQRKRNRDDRAFNTIWAQLQ